jgi:hypothetical protein
VTTFERVGLTLNPEKTVVMTMQGGKLKAADSKVAYERRFDKRKMSHRERMATKVQCQLCGKEVNQQHLKTHQSRAVCKKGRSEYAEYLTTHPIEQTTEEENTATVTINQTQSSNETEPTQYCIEITTGRKQQCPVPNCPMQAETSNRMRCHFRNKHVEDDIIINGEQLPRCPKCGIIQKTALTSGHQRTKECQKWAKIYSNRKQYTEQQQTATEATFESRGTTFEKVKQFKYLGRIVTAKDDDSEALQANLVKARKQWGRIAKFLTREGARPKTMATFYKVIVQTVLLYGAESWVVSEAMLRDLKSFHHRCARYITKCHIRQDSDGTWICPPSAEVLEEVDLLPVQEYLKNRRDTIHKYISTTKLWQKCKDSKVLASNPNQKVWWEQEFSFSSS